VQCVAPPALWKFLKVPVAKAALIVWRRPLAALFELSEAVLVIVIGRNSFPAFEYEYEQQHQGHCVLIQLAVMGGCPGSDIQSGAVAPHSKHYRLSVFFGKTTRSHRSKGRGCVF